MILEYDRNLAVTYAKEWHKEYNNAYPDLYETYGNNISHLYQCLVVGNLYLDGSAHIDHRERGFYPIISRLSNFLKSLKEELRAGQREALDRGLEHTLSTGDLLFFYGNKGVTGMIAERKGPSEVVYYSKDPDLFAVPFPQADKYLYVTIPNLGRYN